MSKINLDWVEKGRVRQIPVKDNPPNLWSFRDVRDSKRGFNISYRDNADYPWLVEYFEAKGDANALVYFDANLNVVKLTTRNGTYTAPRYTERWQRVFAPIMLRFW